MIWRIHEREAFRRLSAEGRRARAGVLWCNYVLDPQATPPRVAFAIGRAYGSAVERNRVRRQLRSVLAPLDLPPGWYLFGVRRDQHHTRSPLFTELVFDTSTLISRLRS